MIQTIDLRGRRPSATELLALIPRSHTDVSAASVIAQELIDDVRRQGSAALLEQAERLDRVRPPTVRVPTGDIASAVGTLDTEVRDALEEAIDRVRRASAAQVPSPVSTTLGTGAVVTQRWAPIRRVGFYVPGGKAVYPSSVVMNVVPAQVAGVSSVALASPPQLHFGGAVHPTILGAAGLLGVDEIYAMGGAGAIGALAYGVEDLGLEPVQLITGPGNVFVAAAKRLVRGQAGIDAEARADRDPRDRGCIGRRLDRRRGPHQPGRARRAGIRRARHRLPRARRRGASGVGAPRAGYAASHACR
jgi:histidinol dehydrogenase